jgi:PEP-CTERM motif
VSTGGSTLAINSLKAIASAPAIVGGTTTLSRANNGTAYGVDASYNSEAYAGGGAKFGSLGPNVGAVFNAASTFVFGSGAEGAVANTSTSSTYTNSVEWNVNTSTLPSGSGHDLDIGFVNYLQSGTGFSSLTFTLKEDSVAVLTKTFTSVSAANTYFTDDLVNLGPWTSGSTLDVLASLSVTAAGSGNGYGINYMVGVDPPVGNAPRAPVPEPATFSVFGLGLLGLGWSKLRRRLRRAA